MEKTIISIVESYKPKIKDDAIFFAPDIPPEKLKKALGAYASDAVFEEMLVLIDNTLFGSAKEGALITDQRFYAHNLWATPQNYNWKDIEKIILVEEGGNRLQVNGLDFFQITIPDVLAIKLLVDMLHEILVLANPGKVVHAGSEADELKVKPVSLSPIEALRELKKLYDEGILTEEEFKAKKQKYLDLI